MRNILCKELRLAASPLSYLFLLFSLMFLLPGYPILCSVFFVTLGLFQSFQQARESGDILFTVLLPVAKKDAVTGKYLFVCLIELCALLLMGMAMLLRMTVLRDASVYRSNALMNANPFALGMAFLIFGCFNLIFVGGFYRTAYRFSRPFVTYIIIAFLLIMAAEIAHHFPGASLLNAFGTEHLTCQLLLLGAGILFYFVLTLHAYRRAVARFEKIDL